MVDENEKVEKVSKKDAKFFTTITNDRGNVVKKNGYSLDIMVESKQFSEPLHVQVSETGDVTVSGGGKSKTAPPLQETEEEKGEEES